MTLQLIARCTSQSAPHGRCAWRGRKQVPADDGSVPKHAYRSGDLNRQQDSSASSCFPREGRMSLDGLRRLGSGGFRTGGRSAWRDDGPAERAGGIGHAVVVGDNLSYGRAELVCAGEVDRVERAQFGRFEATGFVQDAIVDSQELDASQDLFATCQRRGPAGQQRSRDLCASQRAAHQRLVAREVTSKCG